VPPYLLHRGIWEAIWPTPLAALIISVLVYAIAWKWRNQDQERSFFIVILSFSMLGIVTGMVAGNSREPAVGATLPAVLSLIGGLAIYLVDKGIAERILVSLSIIVLSMNLIVGFFWGAVVRINAEDYYGAGGGGAASSLAGYLEIIPIFVDDLEHSKDFYHNALGFDIYLDQLSPDKLQHWIEVAPKGQTVKFLLTKVKIDPARGNLPTNYVFAVDDLLRTYKKLSLNGVYFLSEPLSDDASVQFIDHDKNIFTIQKKIYSGDASNAKK
jgi:predicted enzyme related to lactoylglutathione lyase